MKDKLQIFVNQNREAFDDDKPSGHLFERIGRPGHHPKNKFRTIKWIATAACLALLLVTGVLLSRTYAPGVRQVMAETEKQPTGGDPVIAPQITQFMQVINLQQEELKAVQKDYPDLYREFSTDLQTLDSAYKELSVKLTISPNREAILEEMIWNLQLQSELLTKQLSIIRNIKQKNDSHEKTRS